MLRYPTEILIFLLAWLWLRLRRPDLAARTLPWVVLACIGSLALRYAVLTLMMVFRLYDDEGYVLHSIHNHLTGGALYDQVQSLYGPTLFLFWRLLSWLGLSATHDTGRCVTLVFWALLSAGSAGLVWKLARSFTLTALTFAFTATYLHVLADEPTHPVALIGVLTLLAAGMMPAEEGRPRATAACLGLIAGLLAMTKLNTGLLLVAANGLWWLWIRRHTSSLARHAFHAGALMLVLVPCVLMRRYLGFEGVLEHLFIVTLVLAAGLGCVWRSAPSAPASLPPAPLALPWLAGLLAGLLVPACYALLTGSSLSGLVHGVVLDPLRNLTTFHVPVPWFPASWSVAVACALLSLLSGLLPSRLRLPARSIPAILALVGIFLAWTPLLPVRVEAVVLSLGLPAACCCLTAAGGTARRFWLFLVAVLGSLHVFPVAGTHMAVSTLPLIVLLMLQLKDCWSELRRPPSPSPLAGIPRAALLLLALATLSHALLIQTRWFGTRLPLGLPGARLLHVSPPVAGLLNVLTANARLHGGHLFSEPGQFSYNLWSGVPTPTGQNVTQWFKLVEPAAQAEIARILKSDTRSVLIREQTNRTALTIGMRSPSPLEAELAKLFTPLFRLGTHEFLVRTGTTAVPVDVMSVRLGPDRRSFVLEFTHAFDTNGERLCSAELLSISENQTASTIGTLNQGGVEYVPVDNSGRRLAPAGVVPLGTVLSGLARVTVGIPLEAPPPPGLRLLLVLRRATGDPLAYVLPADTGAR